MSNLNLSEEKECSERRAGGHQLQGAGRDDHHLLQPVEHQHQHGEGEETAAPRSRADHHLDPHDEQDDPKYVKGASKESSWRQTKQGRRKPRGRKRDGC